MPGRFFPSRVTDNIPRTDAGNNLSVTLWMQAALPVFPKFGYSFPLPLLDCLRISMRLRVLAPLAFWALNVSTKMVIRALALQRLSEPESGT